MNFRGNYMKIHGLNKLTLLDYPGHMACTVFTGHCNMCCPFCHNAPLVLFPDAQPQLSEKEFFAFLTKRRGVLEGVCITGGEPTLAPDLPLFIEEFKALGYLVKLYTNGTNPDLLRRLIAANLIDFVAMDIKSSLPHYAEAVGIPNFCTDAVRESADFLMRAEILYEFRTTVVREFHKREDFSDIGRWIKGAQRYYLQSFRVSGDLIRPGLRAYTKEILVQALEVVQRNVPNAELRGVE